MTDIEACIFDLDGVICDTAKYHFLAWKAMAAELAIDFTENDNELLKGVSRVRSLEIILELGNKTISEDKKLALMTQKNESYLEYIRKMDKSKILPGVEELLIELKACGIKIVLGSASKNAPLILDQLELTSYFDAIIDGNQVANAKPDPEVFLKGAAAVGANPANCVVYEDAIAGVEAAINGGMYCIGIGEPDVLSKAYHVMPGLQNFTLTALKSIVEHHSSVS